MQATSGTGAREKMADQPITVMVTDEAEAPAAPATPSVSAAGPTSLTVSWSEPSNSGPPITDYDYRYQVRSPEGPWMEVTTTTITELGATIGELAENTEYNVQVLARNDEGSSDWSAFGQRQDGRERGAVVQFAGDVRCGGEPDRGGYGGGVGRRHRGQRDGVHDRGRRGPPRSFSIVSATGVLTFVAAPNYEAPADADGNNAYEVVVRGDQRHGCAGEDGGPADHGDGDGRGGGARRAQPRPRCRRLGPTSLTVSWSEPSNSGPPITDYDYRYPGEVA